MDQNKNKNSGVVCEVTECHYHTGDNCCTAEKIEVCNCKVCGVNWKRDILFNLPREVLVPFKIRKAEIPYRNVKK